MNMMMKIKEIKSVEKAAQQNKMQEQQMFMEILGTIFSDPKTFEAKKQEYRNIIYNHGKEARELWLNEFRNEVESKRDYEKLLRWDHVDTLLTKFSPKNQGKIITDNNPLFNIMSVEEMDVAAENEPHYDKSGVQADLGAYIKWVMPNNERATGNIFKYLPEITRDQMRMKADLINPEPVASVREEDMVKLKKDIFEKARDLGFGVVGVTKVDRRYIGDGKDEVAPFDNIVILGMEMIKEEIEEYPNPGKFSKEQPIQKIYAISGEKVHELADFVRSKGWKAHPRVSLDGAIKFPPHAVNAGIANFATSGISVTKEYGTRLRWCALVVEAELPLDQPKDFNVEEFCSRCRMCQKSCPTQAIPKEALRHRGAMRRRVSDLKCFSSMIGVRNGCAHCIKVCPYHKFGYDKAMESLPDYYNYNLMKKR